MRRADGNVLTGAGTTSGVADLQGADGGVTVVGVAAGKAARAGWVWKSLARTVN
jgi:hypothetical protein